MSKLHTRNITYLWPIREVGLTTNGDRITIEGEAIEQGTRLRLELDEWQVRDLVTVCLRALRHLADSHKASATWLESYAAMAVKRAETDPPKEAK